MAFNFPKCLILLTVICFTINTITSLTPCHNYQACYDLESDANRHCGKNNVVNVNKHLVGKLGYNCHCCRVRRLIH